MLKTILHWIRSHRTVILSNVAPGIHSGGNKTYLASTAIASKYLFGAAAATEGQIALAGSADTTSGTRAVGVITDEADAIGDPVNVTILGAAGATMKVQAAETITVGALLTSNSASKAVKLSTQSAGTYYVYGIALTSAAAGELVEFAPTPGLTQTVSA